MTLVGKQVRSGNEIYTVCAVGYSPGTPELHSYFELLVSEQDGSLRRVWSDDVVLLPERNRPRVAEIHEPGCGSV